MSIPSHARSNFQTLLRAAGDGNLALMECLDAVTGSPRYVICAVGRDDGDYVFTPFGHASEVCSAINLTIDRLMKLSTAFDFRSPEDMR